MWIKVIVRPIRAAERTIGGLRSCGWEIGRRVARGCRFGRVVFPFGAAQVNSRLCSLALLCRDLFATGNDNGRAKTRGLCPAVVECASASRD